MIRKCNERKPLHAGQKFWKLTVIRLNHVETKRRKNGVIRHRYMYLCQCDCGNKHVVHKELLLSGHIKSCGCYQYDEEYKRKKSERSKKHGMTNTPLFRCWCALKNRCNNPNVESYPNYGGRGITYTSE